MVVRLGAPRLRARGVVSGALTRAAPTGRPGSPRGAPNPSRRLGRHFPAPTAQPDVTGQRRAGGRGRAGPGSDRRHDDHGAAIAPASRAHVDPVNPHAAASLLRRPVSGPLAPAILGVARALIRTRRRYSTRQYELVLMLDPEAADEARPERRRGRVRASRASGALKARRLGRSQDGLRDRAAQRGRLPVLPLRDRCAAPRRARPQPEDRRRRAAISDLQGRSRRSADRAPAARLPGRLGPLPGPRRLASR